MLFLKEKKKTIMFNNFWAVSNDQAVTPSHIKPNVSFCKNILIQTFTYNYYLNDNVMFASLNMQFSYNTICNQITDVYVIIYSMLFLIYFATIYTLVS
jgi:hypothetical protein